MNCPVCGSETRVIDSRTADDGESIRRRRVCLQDDCAARFTTYERIEQHLLVVRKKDGRRQAFDLEKMRRGVAQACAKRPIAAERIDALVGSIELELRQGPRRIVPVEDLSVMVLTRLRELDEVAYLRFASVNREFASADDFLLEAQELDRGE